MVIPPSSDTDRHRPASPKSFVGRERELSRFRAIIDRVRDGHGHLVLVSGEAGIGKTTLMTTVIELSSTDAALVLTGHSYDLTTTPPYGPWLEILQACRRRGGFPPPNTLSDGEALATAANQSVLFDAFVTFFQDIAVERLLVLMLEDMHWADQASLDLLRFLTRQIDQSRILVVVSYRDDEITRRHPLFQLLPVLVRETPVERLQLHRLDPTHIRALVTSRYMLAKDDADRVTRYVAELANGNPFFVHELLTALEDERVLRIDPERTTLQDLRKVRTPPLLKQMIERRLARLNAAAREMLEVAAVIGQDVPLDAWQAVIQIPEDQIDALVQETLDQHILDEAPDSTGWRFTHALVRETLHEGIALVRRRRLHRQVAEILAQRPLADPDAVAHHFQQAGDLRAADWLIQAGERAQRSHAWFIAADRFEAAVGLLQAVPARDHERAWLLYRISQLRRYLDGQQGIDYLDGAFRLASDCGDQELVAAVLQGRGLLKCFVGDFESGLSELEAGIIAAERLGVEAAANVRPGGALNRGAYAMWLAFAGRFDDAVEVAQQQLSETTAPAAQGSYRALAIAHSFLGQPDLARRAFARAREIAIATNDPPNAYITLRQEMAWAVLPYQADDLSERVRLTAESDMLENRAIGSSILQSAGALEDFVMDGRWGEARKLVDDAIHWQMPGIGDASRWRLMWAAVLAHHQEHAGGTWRRMHELLPSGPPIEPGSLATIGISQMLHLVAQPGFEEADLEIARTWLDAFDRWLDWNGAVLGRAENAILWAQYHQAIGDLAQAQDMAERALACASDPRQPLALIAARRVLGQLAARAGRHLDAEHHLRESVTLADACAVPFDRALALLALAELRIASGNRADARALLAEVVAICEPLAARPALDRAKALLTELDVQRRPADRPGGLSAREIDVLRLVAKGMIDREIADALFISPRTVTTHVTHILDKLGVNTRTEAVACAVRVGII